MRRQWTSLCPGESPFKIRLSLLPANYKHCTPRATIFHSGSPSSPLPLPNHSLQSNSSKDLPILLPLPTQAEHTLSRNRLTAFQQLFQSHTHPQPLCCLIYCSLCKLGPHPHPHPPPPLPRSPLALQWT